MTSYSTFSRELQNAGIGLSAAELHGFLSGLLCGGIHDQSWQPLLFQFTNDDHAYPASLLSQTVDIYHHLQQKLSDIDGFNFELWLPEDGDVFARADALSEWSNHFLLGLGLAQPQLDKEKGEIGEAVADLHDICQLGYESDEDQEEMSEALEEIIEYLRTMAALFYSHFHPSETLSEPILH